MTRHCIACGGDVVAPMPASLCARCHHERTLHRLAKRRLRASALTARLGRRS